MAGKQNGLGLNGGGEAHWDNLKIVGVSYKKQRLSGRRKGVAGNDVK